MADNVTAAAFFGFVGPGRFQGHLLLSGQWQAGASVEPCGSKTRVRAHLNAALTKSSRKKLMLRNAKVPTAGFARELIRSISSVALALGAMRLSTVACSFLALWLTPLPALPQVALYLAALNLVSIASFGRFELLVLSAGNPRAYSTASHLSAATAAISILGIVLLVAIAPVGAGVKAYAMLFALGLLARAWLRLGLIFSMQNGTQTSATLAMLPHAPLQQCLLLLLLARSWDPLLAFALADIVGHLIAAACVCRNQWRAFRTAFGTRRSAQSIWELAHANFELPTRNLSSTVSAAAFGLLPMLFLFGLPNTVLAGSMIVALRLLELPASLISGSVTLVIMNKLAEAKARNELANFSLVFCVPLGLAGVTFGAIALASLVLCHCEMLSKWHLVFALLPVAALFQTAVAGSMPLVEAAGVVGYKGGMMGLNVATVTVAGAALVACRHDPALGILIAGGLGVLRAAVMTRRLLVNRARPLALQA